MRERMPFAVVGSNMTITDPSTGQMYRGREYPWGCVNIEDKVGLTASLARLNPLDVEIRSRSCYASSLMP